MLDFLIFRAEAKVKAMLEVFELFEVFEVFDVFELGLELVFEVTVKLNADELELTPPIFPVTIML